MPLRFDLVLGLVQNLGMASHVNIHQAKTQWSRLLAQVEAGEEVTITKAGKPIAKLVPVHAKAPRRAKGVLSDVRLAL